MVRSLIKRWDDYLTAITFAELGEFDFAKFLVKKKKEKVKAPGWDEVFTAITFAEEGEFETAKMLVKSKKRLLFIIEEEVDRDVLSYVEGLCKRLNLPVEILFFGKKQILRSVLNELFENLKAEGLLFKVTQFEETQNIDQILPEYLSKNEGVDFLIVKPSLTKTAKDDEKLIKSIWEKLGFPLILVKEKGAH
ncbi:MAG: hypothetical protein ACP5KO_02040 [Caldimicrobium sp.]|jgi:hypothetical protein